MKKTDMNRRRLLKAGALGFACAPFLGGCTSNPKKQDDPPSPAPEPEPRAPREDQEQRRVLRFNADLAVLLL